MMYTVYRMIKVQCLKRGGCEGDLELAVEGRVMYHLEVAARCTF